jgi:hypothetical protein
VRSYLRLDEGGYELAAEVGDVGDDAAPDQVKTIRRSREPVFGSCLKSPSIGTWSLAGVTAGVVREAREEAKSESYRRPCPWEINTIVDNPVRVHRAREDGMLGSIIEVVLAMAARIRY